MNLPPPSSERSVIDMAISWPSGISTNTPTKSRAGATIEPARAIARHDRAVAHASARRASREIAYSAGDRLHLLARFLDRPVDVAVEDRALQHVDPRARVRIDHVGEMEDPRHVADAERLRRGDDARVGGEILVVGERRPRRQDVVLGEPLELGFVGQLPGDELLGERHVLRARRDGDDVAADEGGDLAFLDARQEGRRRSSCPARHA